MSGPSANDLLTGTASAPGGGARPAGRAPAAARSDLALMKIMWARVGWPEPVESILDIARNPEGKSETARRRPRIVPPGRKDSILYYSPSNTAQLPDGEKYNLNLWKQRKVMLGTALDPGIQDLAISHQDDDRYSNGLVLRAMNRAKGDEGADKGTARHKAAEKLDFLGWDALGPVSPRMRADLEAYQKATRGLEMVLGEMFVVDDVHKMGGTFDRVIYDPVTKRYYIADLKPPDTGYGQGEHAIQFAIYSRAALYNWNLAQLLLATNPKALPTTQLRCELPEPLDQDRAIVIHVPRDGIGRAYTAWVDIAEGWEGFQLAKRMRRWQNRDFQEGLIVPFTPRPPATVIDTAASGVAQLARRNERSPESVERVAALAGAAPFRERGVTDGRPTTDVPLPDPPGPTDPPADELVRRAGGVTEIDDTDPAHPSAQITRALRTSTTLDQLKAVYAAHKTNGWTDEHTALYRTRRVEVTGEPLPERSTG